MFEGHAILMLRQVDDFLISCKLESVAKQIHDHICNKLQLSGEKVPPFKHLGPATDHNGVDMNQTKQHIKIACPGCVDRSNRAHGWDNPGTDKIQSRPTSPMPENSLDVTHAKQGPIEGSKEHKQLQKKMGFACRTLLGELLCACVTCRPDIGFAVTTLAKFSAHPHETHHKHCLLYTSPSPRDKRQSRMPSSA